MSPRKRELLERAVVLLTRHRRAVQEHQHSVLGHGPPPFLRGCGPRGSLSRFVYKFFTPILQVALGQELGWPRRQLLAPNMSAGLSPAFTRSNLRVLAT